MPSNAFARPAFGPALAQNASPLEALINDRSRGNWDDQFDAKAAARTAAAVQSNKPILGPDSVPNIQQAIAQYQSIVSNGGWPQINPTSQQPLQIGVTDPAVQTLRQHLMVSGDLPREAGISSSFDSYVDGAVKRFQARHGLPADIRTALEGAMKDATKYANAIAQQENDAALAAVQKTGKTTIYTLSDKEKAEWRKALTPVQTQMGDRIGKDLIAAVNKEAAALGQK